MKKQFQGTYLVYDKRIPECKEIAEYLTQKGIPFTEVPCSGQIETKLVIGVHCFYGIDRIKKGIEKLLEEGELVSSKRY